MGAMLLKVEFSAPSVRLYGEGTWAHIHCTLASHSIEFVKNWAHDLSYLPHLPQPSCLPLCPQVFNSYWVLFVLPPENIPPLYFSLHCSWVTSRLGLGDFPPELLQQHPNFSLLQKPVLKKPSTTLGELENSDLLHWHAQRSWHSKLWAPKKEVTGFFIHGHYQGPAPVGSRDSLRRMASVIKKVKGERKRLDLPWFTQKANKAPDSELALFTEAAGALSVGWGHRTPSPRWRRKAPSRTGLRSPGKKVNSESPCAPRTHPERRTERENERKGKKNETGRPSFSERGP